MPNFMPSFIEFQKLVRSIPDEPTIALQLQSLRSNVKNQTLEEVQAVIGGIVKAINRPEILRKIDAAGKGVEVFGCLERLCLDFADYIKKDNPVLAAEFEDILNSPKSTAAEERARMHALKDKVANQEFIAAFSACLKSHLTPKHLNRAEHIESVMDEAFETLRSDNNTRASQSIYDPERDFIRQLFRLLFTICKAVGPESILSAKPHTNQEPKIQFRPMPGPR